MSHENSASAGLARAAAHFREKATQIRGDNSSITAGTMARIFEAEADEIIARQASRDTFEGGLAEAAAHLRKKAGKIRGESPSNSADTMARIYEAEAEEVLKLGAEAGSNSTPSSPGM